MYRPVGKPTEYTDGTLITVPVLEVIGLPRQQQGASDARSLDTLTVEKDVSKKEDKGKSLSGFFRRKSSSFNALSDNKVNITIRQVPRKEYVKHYAKDERGRYVGTEDPAEDCMLDEEDSVRWRGPGAMEAAMGIQEPMTSQKGVEVNSFLDPAENHGDAVSRECQWY